MYEIEELSPRIRIIIIMMEKNNYEDLQENIIDPYDAVDGIDEWIPVVEHGTHVAGIIAAEIKNSVDRAVVAPKIKIMPINVFQGEDAYASDTSEAIYRAVDHGAYEVILRTRGEEEHRNRCGWSESIDESAYLASYEHVVSIASTTPWDSTPYFSNYGPMIDVSAPGSFIYSTLPEDDCGEMSGTSMVSLIVAGVVVPIKANEPNLTGDQIATLPYDVTGGTISVYNASNRVKKANSRFQFRNKSVNLLYLSQ